MQNVSSFAVLDCGSVACHVVVFDANLCVLFKERFVHEGRLGEVFSRIMYKVMEAGASALIATSDVPVSLLRMSTLPVYRIDARLSLIEGAKAVSPALRSILHVGAERFFLLRFDEDGRYLDLKSNSSCAAGTGGFLDQQARRLSLSGSEELGERALASRGEAPRIASRCSVFAKTDLIHAQQEGYSLDEICDGLCRGLVATICDAVFVDPPDYPLVFSGGVALNRGVLRALEDRLGRVEGTEILVPQDPDYLPLRGAAVLWLEDLRNGIATPLIDPVSQSATADQSATAGTPLMEDSPSTTPGVGDIEVDRYPLLEIRYSEYPDFSSMESLLFTPTWKANAIPVELDRYVDLAEGETEVVLGMDIGSTSTKATLLDVKGEPVAGFYTRTAGQPLDAIRSLFEAMEDLANRHRTRFVVRGAATTGSGRKFVGSVIGADLVLDEISAHARAAVSLNPHVDTIIEIGGQDAKFTTLKNGVVTFSKMNTVCAAGTGSFVEEQAQKLGVPLSQYAERAMGISAPRASDRCTVFMERDINHYLAKGASTPEILAAVLFAVRENYLLKVAETASIGKYICFQGATARNKALVAAFEEKLAAPIFVSRYCHLTGALGAALTLMEERALFAATSKSAFRGTSLWRHDIPMETEICELCRNNCRIRVVDVDGAKVAFGFMCGRDYDTKHYVAKKENDTFTREREAARERALASCIAPPKMPVMGLPYALQGVEEFPLWKHFFTSLGIPLASSESLERAIALGKKESGAEFCAPISAFYGHLSHLAGRCDVLFMPSYLEYKEKNRPDRLRKYCYYTQFSAALGQAMLDKREKKPLVASPVFKDRANGSQVREALWESLKGPYEGFLTKEAVFAAFDEASVFHSRYRDELRQSFVPPAPGAVSVALLGRPYTILSTSMNKAVPTIFQNLGVSVCYQDMLDIDPVPDAELEALLDQVHWRYASEILAAAAFCARTPGLYPVFMTSFKCAPDSIIGEYLTRILERAGKPFLVLQLDEHDSNVGYETRIEAAIRAFRNHRAEPLGRPSTSLPVAPRFAPSLKGKTVLLPAWDPVAIRLLAASLRHAGYDARALEESPQLVREGLKTNTGQCIPLNVIAHEFCDYIRRNELDPEHTVLWMIKAGWACNIGMYPSFIRSLVEKEGGGMEKAGVYVGDLTMIELGPMVTARAYFAYLYAGLIHRLSCRIRPYEMEPGATDRAAKEAIRIFEEALEGKRRLKKAAREVGTLFTSIKRDESRGRRPKVAIFGDLYLRDNPVMNQDLVKAIEGAGGEVVVIAYTEYTKIVSSGHFQHWIKEQKYREFVFFRALLAALQLLENIFQDASSSLAGPGIQFEGGDISPYLEPFHVSQEHEGETFENLLKVRRLVKTYPDIRLFVHTSPAFCCPSLVTEALAPRIEEETGVPVVNIIYDGTSAYRNDILAPYLKYPRGDKAQALSKDAVKKEPADTGAQAVRTAEDPRAKLMAENG